MAQRTASNTLSTGSDYTTGAYLYPAFLDDEFRIPSIDLSSAQLHGPNTSHLMPGICGFSYLKWRPPYDWQPSAHATHMRSIEDFSYFKWLPHYDWQPSAPTECPTRDAFLGPASQLSSDSDMREETDNLGGVILCMPDSAKIGKKLENSYHYPLFPNTMSTYYQEPDLSYRLTWCPVDTALLVSEECRENRNAQADTVAAMPIPPPKPAEASKRLMLSAEDILSIDRLLDVVHAEESCSTRKTITPLHVKSLDGNALVDLTTSDEAYA